MFIKRKGRGLGHIVLDSLHLSIKDRFGKSSGQFKTQFKGLLIAVNDGKRGGVQDSL